MKKSIVILFLVLVLCSLTAFAATLWTTDSSGTPKTDFSPYETVYIHGSGFSPNAAITIDITRPDNIIEVGFDVTGVFGDFLFNYNLNGINGTYYVHATDGSKNAYTTFTDPPPAGNLDQCRNGAASSPESPCTWVNGNLGQTNSHYIEGQSVAYRLVLTNMLVSGFSNCSMSSNRTCEVTIEYDIKHSSKNAIDYLTYFQRISEVVNPCSGIATCNSALDNVYDDIPLPNGTPQPQNSFNALPPNQKRIQIYNGNITNISYVTHGDLNAAQSATSVKIKFKVNSSTVVLSWGGHIGSRLDWGEGNSAGGISGSPYHMRFLEICSPNDGGLDCQGGNQDRSLSADAVTAPNGTIIIIKDTIPDTPQDFNFTLNGFLFTLDDDIVSATPKSRSFSLVGGIYNVTEAISPGYNLSNINCTDPTGFTTTNLNLRRARINLTSGENVTCVFTNTRLPFCGDNITNGNEECDDGNQINTDGCRNDCTLPFCGDGILDSGEQCDDGNTIDGDGCTANCITEFCGDNTVQYGLGEECEPPSSTDNTNCGQTTSECLGNQTGIRDSFGNCDSECGCDEDPFEYSCLEDSCSATCDSNDDCDDQNEFTSDFCNLNSCGCFYERVPRCGDEIVDPGEQCDDGNQNNSDDCRNNCRFPFCGDGIKDSNEECDDGNTDNLDACRNDCVLPTCGDDILDYGEECDDGNNNDGDGCNSDCIEEFCGDGIVQEDLGEECDDGNIENGDGCDEECQSEECEDPDHDGVCDDDCPDSKPGEPVDENGCDIFQFCKQFSCGLGCLNADWMGNEGNITYPQDCTIVIPEVEGQLQQPRCVPTENTEGCAG